MATTAKRDPNNVPVEIAVSNADGISILMLQADPVTHALSVADGTTGSDHGTPQAKRDQNAETAMMAVSNDGQSTPTALYVDAASNNLLVKST